MSFIDQLRNNAIEALHTGTVKDIYKWNFFCTILKTFPHPDNIFKIITQCCDICQRDIYHTEEDHESCCGECAKAKNASEDIIPFVMKEYYHMHQRWYDDTTDIWFAQDQNPVIYTYEMIDIRSITEDNLYDHCHNICASCNRYTLPDDFKNNMTYIV